MRDAAHRAAVTADIKDVPGLRAHLDQFEAELQNLDDEINALTRRRDALTTERSSTNGDVVRGWKIDEEVAGLEPQIKTLLEAKLLPAERAAQLRAVLAPVEEREREAAHRAAAAQGCELLLEVFALLDRTRPLLDEALRVGRGHLGFDTSIRKLADLVNRWDEVTAPQLREQLASHRRFIRAAGPAT